MKEIFTALLKLIGCILAFLIGTLLAWVGLITIGFTVEAAGFGFGSIGIMLPCFLMAIYTTELLWHLYNMNIHTLIGFLILNGLFDFGLKSKINHWFDSTD